MPAGLSKQEISSQHSNAVVEAAVNSGNASPSGRFINHIVVNERCGVDHLSDLSQPAMPRGELTIGRQGARHQQNDAGADFFAASTEEVLSGRLKNGMTGANQAAQITEKRLKVELDRLQQLSNGGHGSPRWGDPRRPRPLIAG